MAITKFDGDWAGFSNFAPCNIKYEGMVFRSVEHAFQAAKTLDRVERKSIQESRRCSSRPGTTNSSKATSGTIGSGGSAR